MSFYVSNKNLNEGIVREIGMNCLETLGVTMSYWAIRMKSFRIPLGGFISTNRLVRDIVFGDKGVIESHKTLLGKL